MIFIVPSPERDARAVRGAMQKGEYAISVTLAAVVVFVVLAIQTKWQPASLKEAASQAGEFIMTTTGIGGQIPEVVGYERVKTFRLDRYRAGLYRASPAPLVFAPGRFAIYNRENQPVFKLETLEGSKEPWTALYDFSGRRGLAVPGSRTRAVYTRSLIANGEPDLVIGQYSGGDHCCTTATVVELGKESVRVLARIEALDGLPFEGLDFRRIDNDAPWEIIAHRPQRTLCGSHDDAADILSLYAYADGKYTDQTSRSSGFVESVLRQNLAKWSHEKARSLELLQTLAANYAELGQREQAKRFFAMNLSLFLPKLQKVNVDPNACLEDVERLMDKLPSVTPSGKSDRGD